MSPSLNAIPTVWLSFLIHELGSVYGISQPFGWLFHSQGQVTHVFLTRSPLYYSEEILVRLACVKRAASVRSEPGSNSQKMFPSHKGRHFNTLTCCIFQLFICQRAHLSLVRRTLNVSQY